MRKIILTLAVCAAAAAAFLIRWQPRGTATVFSSGEEIGVRRGVLFLRPLFFDSSCRVRTAGDNLQFESTLPMRSATGDEFEALATISYNLPPRLQGTTAEPWCRTVSRIIEGSARARASKISASDLLADRREAGHVLSDSITIALRSRGVAVASARMRIDLPRGFERLRSTPVAAMSRSARPVIFIGLDGADWELLDDYIRSGSMPALGQLVGEGSSGILETEHPPLSPLLWTTMFTGVSPLDHQILDFTRFNPHTNEREPITSDERRAPAIWNMLTSAGKRVAMFGMWATYAAEPVHGINVSDRFFTFLFSESSVPAGAVYPDSRTEWARNHLRRAEAAVDLARLRRYLPSMSEGQYGEALRETNPYAKPASALRRILVETEVYRTLSSDFLSQAPLPDLSIVYIQGTDSIGHVFAPYAPPRQPEISAADYAMYNAVPQRYFREVDDILRAFMTLARERHAVIVIASDHGFRWREGRPTQLSSIAAASAAKWHRNEGIFAVWGEGVQPSRGHTQRAGIRQLCATLAALSGVPVPQNAAAPFPGLTASTDTADYARFFERALPPPAPTSTGAANEEIAKLRALGYIGSTESSSRSTAAAPGDTRTAGAWNNAGLILRQQKKDAEAREAFSRAIALDSQYASAKWNLSEMLFADPQKLDESDELLVEALGNALPEGPKYVIGRAIHYQRSGRGDRSTRLLDRAIAARPADAELHLFRGRYRMERQDCHGAAEDFEAATRNHADAIGFASLGLARMCLGDAAGARASFERSLQLDPDQPMLRQYLGR